MTRISKTDVLDIARALAKPIDFELLEERGILKRRSMYWFEILDAKEVPDHVWQQARELRSEGASISIRLPVSWKGSQKALKKLERDLA